LAAAGIRVSEEEALRAHIAVCPHPWRYALNFRRELRCRDCGRLARGRSK
jgi:hypothetical protein